MNACLSLPERPLGTDPHAGSKEARRGIEAGREDT